MALRQVFCRVGDINVIGTYLSNNPVESLHDGLTHLHIQTYRRPPPHCRSGAFQAPNAQRRQSWRRV